MRVECETLISRRRFSVEFPSGTRFGIRCWLTVQVVGLAIMLGSPFAIMAED